jgi:hypothetical protein
MDYNKFRELFHKTQRERDIEQDLAAKKAKKKNQKKK